MSESEAAVEPLPKDAGAATAEPAASATTEVRVKIADLEKGGGTNIREIDAKNLIELADSIREHGVLEPVLFRETPKGLVLIAGYRRVAAAKIAGLKEIPARRLDVDQTQAQEIQLVENLQREGLTPVEEARAMRAYIEGTKSTQAQLCKRIGRSSAYVSSRLGILGLPKPVLSLLDKGELSASHAEVLLSIPKEADPKGEYAVAAAKAAIKEKLPVLEVQRRVSRDLEKWTEQAQLQKKLSTEKFPNCPTCKKPATEENRPGFVSHGTYDARHIWSYKTGQTEVQREAAERERWKKEDAERRSSGGSARPRPKPVDCRESPLLRSGSDLMSIVQAMLKESGPDGLDLLEYQTGGRPGAVLRIGLTSKPMGLAHVIGRPVPYSTGERTQFVVQDRSGPERRTRKSEVQAWVRKALPAVKLRASKPKVFDAKQLVGTAGIVTRRLAGLRKDHELLELARSAEASGKHRAAVLDWLDQALGGRGHDDYSNYGNRHL